MDIIPIEDVKKRKMPKLIEHHVKYEDIHGENKTIFAYIES